MTFCPKDDTPACTTEACAFRDARDDLARLGAKVLGVSPDSKKSHAKFAGKFDLKFPLLADTDRAACEAYGVWAEKSMFGKKYMGVERSTFVIDAEGVVRKEFRKVKVPGHGAAVLAALAEIAGI